jgi:hypothetical protein
LARSNIRIERAKLYTHDRNLDLTMNELERSYAVAPTIDLSQKIAEILFSAGLIKDGLTWLEKGLNLKQPFFDSLFYNPKDQSETAINKINEMVKEKD